MMTANDKKRNKGWARLTLCFIICLGTLPLAAEGKLTLSPYLDYSYSNNIFWNSSSIGDTTVSPGLGLGFTTPSFNFFLNADGKIYRNNAQMNSSMFSGSMRPARSSTIRCSAGLYPRWARSQPMLPLNCLGGATRSVAMRPL